MSLTRYLQKRDFRQTQEPRGSKASKTGWLYVIQKHAASHLHYDFRIQIGATLKSWAVPKGPSLDPGVKRLAMHVEDHPVEYGAFEGTIPQGQYGGGTVMLWDRGTWSIDGDPEQAYRDGKLHFRLHGEKLHGEWVLVKRGGKPTADRGSSEHGKEPWFLFKIRDDAAISDDEDGVLRREPNSVASGRTLDEITQGKGGRRVWSSYSESDSETKGAANGTSRKKNAPKRSGSVSPRAPAADGLTAAQLLAQYDGAKRGSLPTSIKPQLATLVKQAPEGDSWFNEIKFDGYRLIARVEKRKVTFASRNALDWTARVPHLVEAVSAMGLQSAIFDGELVAQGQDGKSDFQSLQNAFREHRSDRLIYYVFDLLFLNGVDLRHTPLVQRKQILTQLLSAQQGPVRDAGYLVGKAPEFFAEACNRGLEGIICKRSDGLYRSGRSADWLKVKCGHHEEFVLGGYTPPAKSRIGFGALLLGYHDEEGQLRYAGRVGTGFSDSLLTELSKRLQKLEQSSSPFVDLSGNTGQARGVHWIKPQLVAQITFSEWTKERHLRHPSFQGLREDKKAAEVTRERASNLPSLKAKKNGKSMSSNKRVPAKKSSQSSSRRSSAKSQASEANLSILDAIHLTHPDKVLYPEEKITKAQLAGYYASVADWILPHVVERPLTLVRCPQGAGGKCFYQKHADKGLPDTLGRVEISEKKSKIEYPVVKDLEDLLSLVQMNTLEIHVWGARIDQVEKPDRLVFDLDPDPSVPWARVVESATQLRAFFAELDLEVFLKTTGGKGLHLVLPIDRRTTWDDARQLCQAIAKQVAAADPERYTANMSKAARPGKIFIDYLRNARGATSVAAYSTRARAGCPVATPISWDELPKLKSASQFTLRNVPKRLETLASDPWRDLSSTRQRLAKSLWKKLQVAS